MYGRKVDDQVLTLGVSGLLWSRSLIMYDEETKTEWSHILGEAMGGKLKGMKLENIPAVTTDWKSWAAQHPNGTVAMLSRTSRNYTSKFYRSLNQFALGIAEGGKAKAWTFEKLDAQPVLEDTWMDRPVVVFFDVESKTPRIYSMQLSNEKMEFHLEGGLFKDKSTGSVWNPVSGRSVEGKLKGQSLKALPGIVTFTHTWKAFHPDSEMVE